MIKKNPLEYVYHNKTKGGAHEKNIPFSGTLEITDRHGTVSKILPERYTYYNVTGEYGYEWIVDKGADADAAWNRFQSIVREYYQKEQIYQDATAQYEQTVETLSDEIIGLKKAGKDYSHVKMILEKMQPPEESTRSNSVVYLDGTTDLYVRPFYQDEYNDLFYERMLNNRAIGNSDIMKWVRIQQVPEALINITDNENSSVSITEKAFAIEQIEGAALGYNILPLTSEMEAQGTKPGMIAFQVPVASDEKSLHFETMDKTGKVLEGSERKIRIIDSSRSNWGLLILALIPLLVMVVLQIKRKRYYR